MRGDSVLRRSRRWVSEDLNPPYTWDPKENGALMIVLWTLIVLYAWRGGYIGLLGACAGGVARPRSKRFPTVLDLW